MKALLECKSRDPYTEIANYIESWCLSDHGWCEDCLVTISRDNEEITEILFYTSMGEFEWEMDWWEGEKDIKLLGFRPISDLKCYGLPEDHITING